ncbi:hypothetical protein ACU686_39975 [Yinghuangia aomiensis]
MLAPPEPHVQSCWRPRTSPVLADRFANGFDEPADFDAWFYTPEQAHTYLASLA